MWMDDRVERRRPDRQKFVLRFLRRIAVAALVLAAALWTVPRGLVALGLLGPTAHDRIEEAARAIATARAYGDGHDLPPLRVAEQSVATARALAGQGKEREARREAERAMASAIEAQKMALVARTAVHQRAEAAYKDLERQINELEKLYEQVTSGMPKERTAPLLSVMKATRVTTGELFLAYEKQDFGTVVDGEHRARGALAAARATLESARK
jgi:hypothetical protein